jgi:hypothetical protein
MGSKDTRTKAEKIRDMANDPGASLGERANAQAAAARLREKTLRENLDAEYQQMVKSARAIVQRQEQDNWELGALASKVEKKYGEARLERFAEDIGINYNTLMHCRQTFLAWQKWGRPQISFWAAYALNKHPDRIDIARKNPTITDDQARGVARRYKAKVKANKEAEKAKKQAAKSKSKDGPEPGPEPEPEPQVIREDVKKLAGIFDGTLTKGGLEEKRAKALGTCNEDERKLVFDALCELNNRVDSMIKKFKNSPDPW